MNIQALSGPKGLRRQRDGGLAAGVQTVPDVEKSISDIFNIFKVGTEACSARAEE
ncbi:MAG: hypothetical protein Q4F00_07750 [bacterium]|nr:hypothetical protein [bacterium]